MHITPSISQQSSTNSPTRRSIGFAAWAVRQGSPERATSGPALLPFDGRNSLSFSEGAHNVLVLGGTGRGKTSSVVLPALDRLLGAGFGGLVVDVKNNFTNQLKSLAALHGRLNDIVELGDFSSAVRINVLDGLGVDDTRTVLRSLAIDSVSNSSNLDWHEKGVNMALDCVKLLKFMAEHDLRFSPRLSIVEQMCDDYDLARRLYLYFKNNMLTDNIEQQLFVRRMTNAKFHLFSSPSSTERDKWEAQLTWQIQRVREALQLVAKDSTMRSNFSAMEPDMSLDFKSLIYDQRKVVVLRFSPSGARAGSSISRLIKQQYYLTVYRHGLKRLADGGEYTFFVADEFQDVMDLESSLSDFDWFSKSREFRNINLVATQSMASLLSRSSNVFAVRSLLSNCSAKIVMQLDDMETINILSAYDLPVEPMNLRLGRVLLLKYSLATRDYSVTEEGVQCNHDQGQERLALGSKLWDEQDVQERPEEPVGLSHDLVMEVLVDDLKAEDSNKSLQDKGFNNWPRLRDFYSRYKRFFSPEVTPHHLGIPPGWHFLAEAAMTTIVKLDVPIIISAIRVDMEEMTFVYANRQDNYSPAAVVLRSILKSSKDICMQCGVQLARDEAATDSPLCDDCRSPEKPDAKVN